MLLTSAMSWSSNLKALQPRALLHIEWLANCSKQQLDGSSLTHNASDYEVLPKHACC